MKPKILLYDLETTPSLGYTWGKFEQNVLKFVKHRELLSVAYKWVGEDSIHCVTREGKKDDKELAIVVRNLFNEADIVIAHNGNKFDKKVAKTRMIAHNLKPVKQVVQVDTCAAARTYFDFNGNSLNDLANFFKLGSKLPHQGLDLWFGCMKDDPVAWKVMAKYNKNDVLLLDKLYKILRPWIENHPAVVNIVTNNVAGKCPDCASGDVTKYGVRPTVSGLRQRWVCKGCGKNFLTRYRSNP